MKRTICGLAILLVAGCSSGAGKKKTISVGAVYDDTGGNKNFYWEQARAMAVDQINKALDASRNGKNLRIVLESRGHQGGKDNNGYAQQLSRELRDLGVRSLFTDGSGTTTRVNALNYDAANPLGLPISCTPCTDTNIHYAAYDSSAGGTKTPDPVADAGNRDVDHWLFRTSILYSPQVLYQMKELFSRAPNGDLNGDGVTKVATYVSKMNDAGAGSGNNNEKAIEDAVKLVYSGEVTFQRVDGPVDTSSATMLADDPATYSNYDADMAKLVALGVDGHSPDFIAVNVIPGFAEGIAQAYALANLNPRPPIAHAASSMRAFIVQELGDSYNGQEGIGNEVYRADASGTKFAADFTALTGAPPAGYDSSVYDAMVTNLLAVLKAALPLADPTEVTPTQVKQAFSAINVPGAQVVRTGTDEFVKAIDAIAVGTDFNYEGASGPVDFDAVGDVRGNVAMWKVENQKFVTEFLWNCVDPPADLRSDWFASPHTMSCALVQ